MTLPSLLWTQSPSTNDGPVVASPRPVHRLRLMKQGDKGPAIRQRASRTVEETTRLKLTRLFVLQVNSVKTIYCYLGPQFAAFLTRLASPRLEAL